jgi:hypothetical protein
MQYANRIEHESNDSGGDAPMTNPSYQTNAEFAVIRSPRLRLLIPLIVAFAFLMEQLDSTIVTTAIPDMARSLGVPPLLMNLTISSYILSLAVFIPVSGWIADRYGARRVFAAAPFIFTVASAFLRPRRLAAHADRDPDRPRVRWRDDDAGLHRRSRGQP